MPEQQRDHRAGADHGRADRSDPEERRACLERVERRPVMTITLKSTSADAIANAASTWSASIQS